MAGFTGLGLSELGNENNYQSASDGGLGKFAVAYGLDKSGLATFMNKNAPAGYEFSGGKLQKIPNAVPPIAAPAIVQPTMPSVGQPDDIDPRAKATLGMVEQHPMDTQFSQASAPQSNSPVPPPQDYSQGPGLISSLMKMFG